MIVFIKGKEIFLAIDFHKQLAKALNVEQYYGKNLDTLWDLLSLGIERPLTIIWKDSHISKANLGEDFEKIITVLNRVKEFDNSCSFIDKFELELK
ncbi:barstar family protein [Faucicola mancuniensis]|uniref:barstar family protein n=1 Tax=Faucicola mancuniensis TaxID=1309795 RepID=UPI0028F165FA|nr:barstar family protein [uncultured Moraxella sp.]